VIGGLTKNQKRASLPMKLPYLRVANVYADELRLEDVKEIGVGESELGRVLLRKGDLLVVEGNGSPDQIGRVALWDGSIDPCVHQNHLIKVRFAVRALEKVALHWLLSARGREHIKRVASSTSGLYTLSITKVQALPVPLPPIDEQEEIIREIERRLSILREIETEVEANLKRAGRLRQSILKRAFEGKLVPQDHTDEPASKLLERIREERERSTPRKKDGRKKAPREGAESPQESLFSGVGERG
jgi:type I restriction enzyme, S subunit